MSTLVHPRRGPAGTLRASPAACEIVLFSNIPDSRAGGMGNWTHEMARALVARGHRATPWFADALPHVGPRATVLLHPLAFAWRAVRARRGVHAFVVHEPSGFWYALLRSAWRALPPMVCMCHNVENRHVACLDEAAARGFARRRSLRDRVRYALARAWQSRGAIRLADHVVVLSEPDRQWVMRVLGRTAADVTLLVNGVDASPAPTAGDGSSAPGAAAGVLVVGGWLDTKGRVVLPRLWRRVRELVPGARLTLAGTGRAADTVLGDFSAADRDSVTVIPRVESPEHMIPLYRASAVLLQPSLSEGSPLAVLEAMREGLGIAAARVGGIPLLVRDGVEALLFDPFLPADGAAAVSRLLGDPDLRSRLGEAARARAATFTWDRAGAALLDAVRRARGEAA